MLHEQTVTKLQGMKLFGMVEALEEQRRQARSADLGFEDRLALLVERQWLWKENRALRTRLQHARLKTAGLRRGHRLPPSPRPAALGGREPGDLGVGPLPPALHHHRADRRGQDLPGCALGNKACRDGYRVRYWSTPKLLRELSTALGRRQSRAAAQDNSPAPTC